MYVPTVTLPRPDEQRHRLGGRWACFVSSAPRVGNVRTGSYLMSGLRVAFVFLRLLSKYYTLRPSACWRATVAIAGSVGDGC